MTTVERTTVPLYGSHRSPADQREAFRTGQVPVAVYGLGKMGLPLAAVFADVTGNVVGADIDPDLVAAVNRGESPLSGEPGLDDLLERVVGYDEFTATDEPREAAREAAVHVVIVPTLIDDGDQPDLAALEAVTRDVAASLHPGDLVVLESTVPPGTSRDVVQPLLVEHSDLESGEFGVAFCPERTSSGRAIEDIRGAYPKVVGGVDDESTRAAALVYDEVNSAGTIAAADATTAEAVKVFEGVYRDVNIALANELAQFADELGISVNQAIDVANTQPYCDIHDPGPGVGGHCIPLYPYFLTAPFETDAPLLRTARAVNDGMPAFTADRVREELAADGRDVADATVLVLGLTYRPGVNETTKSPAGPLVDRLQEYGAEVLVADPMLEAFDEFGGTPVTVEEAYDRAVDAVVLVTPHEEFEDVDWTAFDDLVVVDGRRALDLDGTDHRVYTIGGR